jgi:D-sedoheptulose 7-phosphate isomerase
LHVNTSFLTAVANDYSFETVFARMLQATGKEGDVLIALSTSGNSLNVIQALEQARKMGMMTVGLTGETGGRMGSLCDILVNVPSRDTPRIQEAHILIGHILCQWIESNLFPR